MATIKFLLQGSKESTPIYLRLSLGRVKGISKNETPKFISYKRKIGISINPNNWSTSTGLPKQNNATNKNITSRLRKLTTFVIDKLNDANSNAEIINGDWLQYQIELFFNRISESNKSELITDAIQKIINEAHTRDNAKGGIGLTTCRVNSYKRLKELFIEYQGEKKILIKELDQIGFNNFRTWLLDKKNYSHSYAIKKISDLKTVCKDARKNGIETSKQLNDIKIKQVKTYDDDMDVIILTPQELEQIEKTTIFNDALNNAKKWLLLACYTGQRGKALTTKIIESNFDKRGSEYVIKITQNKGNKTVLIPVHPKVKEIYKNGLPYKISLTKLNIYFKEIGNIAGINTPTLGRKQEGCRGVKKVRPKYEYISTHIGRRSFASNHYGKLPTPIIMRVTGHAKESTFLQYINQTDNSHIDTFMEFYKEQDLQEKESKLKIIKGISI